jgi:hypothetical protein
MLMASGWKTRLGVCRCRNIIGRKAGLNILSSAVEKKKTG